MTAQERLSHASLNLGSRNLKAQKIERLLDLANLPQPLRTLEIGTGSGGIAHYFATHPTLRCEVTAVDVRDNRQIKDGYEFQLVKGVQLPFDSAQFDLVITNHVIEHVGNCTAQHQHLSEIHRVLKPQGVGYLAVPNRWMLIEPHYRLMFLSWWPHSWRTPYLRLMHKGTFYDCEPLRMGELEQLLTSAEFQYTNLCVKAWRTMLDIERPGALSTHLLRHVPDVLLERVRPAIPTLIYRIARTE